jgi:puromycin-sensitive aminopeptidase
VTQDNPYRLPRDVRPVRYDLVLEPDLDAATFVGLVDIEVEIDAPTAEIVVNAAELDLLTVTVNQGTAIEASNVELDAETERATLSFPVPLAAGSATLSCRFTGVLNDKLRGFYRSTYNDDEGVEHTIATTQFESTNARRAFPCFDEPDFKAVFGVTLVVSEDLMAISCGELIDSVPLDGGRRRDRFTDTMIMSTYLVAFIVGELEATDPIDVDGVPLRVVHVPGKADLTAFGLEAGEFSLRWLVDYYGIAYPAGKLDLVAVPDFAFGAMENLGCVTFRETLLLADPDRTTQSELTRIIDVIAHEIAHMWFGNLVTMDWWNGIWLKEAFATFMQVATTDAFRPAWRRWDSFSLERGAAFDTDALHSTRPIEFEVVSPEDAEGMYDILTYEKGAAVVRMLEQYLGTDEFRRGVNHYLDTHSYLNTTTTDLWDSLETATGVPVRAAMDTWIFQGGHPIITVTSSPSGVTVGQRRFEYCERGDTSSWHVPVMIRAMVGGKLVEERLLLTDLEADVDLGGSPDWVVVNAGGHGFYRVRYNGDLLAALSERALDVLGAAERYGLVDDVYAAVVAGDTDADDFISLVTGLDGETDLGVWQRILGGLTQLHSIAEAEGRERLAVLVRDLTTTALGILGYEPSDDEPDLDRELRAALFSAAGGIGRDQSVRERARQLFDVENNGGSVEPNLAAAAVRVVASAGDDATYDEMVELYRNASTPQSELRYLGALLQFEDGDLFERTLHLILTEVRTQNAPFMLATAMTHLDHGPRAWELVRSRWDELNERFPQNSIPRMVGGVRALSTAELARDVEGFFAEHPVPQGTLMVAQHLEKLRINVGLREREGSRLSS